MHFLPARKLCRFGSYTVYLLIINISLVLMLVILNVMNSSNEQSTSIFDQYQTLAEKTLEAFQFMKQVQSGRMFVANSHFSKHDIVLPWCWTRISKPSNSSIIRSADLWQSVRSNNLEIHLYSAYWDTRPDERTVDAAAFVRILGMAWESVSQKLYCHLFLDSDSSLTVEASVQQIWERSWDPRNSFYFPYLFSCPLPAYLANRNPVKHVSISTEPCYSQPTNLLDVFHHVEQTEKNHTVICVKGMDFLGDLSFRLIEWLEANYALGAHKIVLYTYAVHSKMQRVIDYYNNKGRWGDSSEGQRFQSVPLSLPGSMPDVDLALRSLYIKRNRQQKRRNEIIPYNDCIYRHLNTHHYALIVDIDELVVPLGNHDSWEAVLRSEVNKISLSEENFTAFSVLNAFFFDNLTQNSGSAEFMRKFHMLSHNVRSASLSPKGLYGKSFMRIENLLTVFNHYPLHKLKSSHLMPTVYLSANVAQKNHYKASCPVESTKECPQLFEYSVIDEGLAKFQEKIIENVEKILKLGIV